LKKKRGKEPTQVRNTPKKALKGPWKKARGGSTVVSQSREEKVDQAVPQLDGRRRGCQIVTELEAVGRGAGGGRETWRRLRALLKTTRIETTVSLKSRPLQGHRMEPTDRGLSRPGKGGGEEEEKLARSRNLIQSPAVGH